MSRIASNLAVLDLSEAPMKTFTSDEAAIKWTEIPEDEFQRFSAFRWVAVAIGSQKVIAGARTQDELMKRLAKEPPNEQIISVANPAAKRSPRSR